MLDTCSIMAIRPQLNLDFKLKKLQEMALTLSRARISPEATDSSLELQPAKAARVPGKMDGA